MIRKRSQLIPTDTGWLLLWTLNWMNERKGGERDTESSVASSFKLEADQLKIGCSDLQFWALSCWDYDESETLHFPLYCPFWVLTLECAFWDKEWEWQISECRANQRPVSVACDLCWPISRYLTVEVCLCTGQLSYKEQVKPHSSWDWRGFKLLMKVTKSPFYKSFYVNVHMLFSIFCVIFISLMISECVTIDSSDQLSL